MFTSLTRERAALLAGVDQTLSAWRQISEGDDGLVAADLLKLREALEDRSVAIGVFGLIKRGKSTLVNALVGTEVSATRAVPETAVPVRVSYGEQPGATIHLADGGTQEVSSAEARALSSRTASEGLKRPIAMIDQRIDSGLLRSGIRLVDTPGLDEAEASGIHSERTLQQVDAVDAGVVVFQAPPTVGATEIKFLRKLVDTHGHKLVIVCNFYPELYYDEDSREQVLSYVRARLQEMGASSLEIVPVCGLEAWNARWTGDGEGWDAAGGPELTHAIERIASEEVRADLVDRTVEELDRIVKVAREHLAMRKRLLAEPEHAAEERSHVSEQLERRDGAGEIGAIRGMLHTKRVQVETMAMQAVAVARRDINEAKTVDDLADRLEEFRVEIEVRVGEAAQQLTRRLAPLAARMHRQLDDVVVGTEEGMVLGAEARPTRPDDDDRGAAFGGAAVGGLAGGVGLAVVGIAVAPVGLVAGALAGWRLARLAIGGRGLRMAKDESIERLEEIADEVVSAFTERTSEMVADLLAHAERRREALRRDLGRVLGEVGEETDAESAIALCDRVDHQLEEIVKRVDDLGGGAAERELRALTQGS